MRFPVTAGQADTLWYQWRDGHSSSNVGAAMTFAAAIRAEHIVQGILALIEANAALRLKFSGSPEAGYRQEIVPFEKRDVAMDLLDVADADDASARRYIDTLLQRDSITWDWSRRGVCWFRVLKLSGERHCVAMSLQHAAFDARSVESVLSMLRAAVLDIHRGVTPVFPLDRYREAVTATLLAAPAEAAARRYWARELDLLPAAFGNGAASPVGRAFRRKATIDGADYRKIRDAAGSGGLGAAAIFIRRLLEIWREYEPGPCLVDTHFSCRPRGFDEQLGMFSTMRPLVFDLSDGDWRDRVGAKLMRASAYQCVDSIALRALEEERGIRARPFLNFDYASDSPTGATDQPSPVEASGIAVPARASMRPLGMRVIDTGASFAISFSVNSSRFAPADGDRLLHRLVAG